MKRSEEKEAASSSKKQKGQTEWRVSFEQSTVGLRTLFDVVGNVLTSVNIRLYKKRDEHHLCIDSIDPQHVCMIQARLSCDEGENIDEEGVQFCVQSKTLNHCLGSIPQHYSVEISKREGSEDVYVVGYESMSNSHKMIFKLHTLLDESETMSLNVLDYRHTVEIDLSTLRQIVKMSSTLKSDLIEIVVEEPEEGEMGGVVHSVLKIRSEGDAAQEHQFVSCLVDSSKEERVIRAAMDTSMPPLDQSIRMKTLYKDSFSTHYLGLFLKSMERQVIVMKISEEKPLILNYPLGAEESFICFVLAPRQEDGQ